MAEPRQGPSLFKAILKERRWRKKLEEGKYSSARDLAKDIGVIHRFVGRLMRLGYLAPDIIEVNLRRRAARNFDN